MTNKMNRRGMQLSPAERQRVFWEGVRRCVLSVAALIKVHQLDPLEADDERRTTVDGRRRQENTEDGRNITQR